jgi:lipopolysaccharide export system protein LptA
MSAQKASAPVRFAGLAAIAILAVVAGAVAVHLAVRRGASPPAAVKPPPEGRVVDLKEQVRHQEFKEGRVVADVRGASFFRGPDGRNHLKGSVEVVSFGPAGEVLSRLTADEVVYEADTLCFALSGRVRVEAGGAVLEGGSFDYDRSAGLFSTKSGGTFSAKTLTGIAAEIAYAEGPDEVRLAGGFRGEIGATGRAGGPVALAGDSFVYRRRERRGRVEGRAEYRDGRLRGEANSLSFAATEDEGALGSALFDGEARVVLAEDQREGRRGGTVRADRVEATFSRGSGLLSSAQATGAVAFVLGSASRPEAIVRSGTVALGFDAAGGPGDWAASGGVRVELENAGGGNASVGGRVLEGDSAAFDAETWILSVDGSEGRPATADSPEARIEAASIAAGPAEGDLEAGGGVKCLIKPGEARRPTGFFSNAEAVSVSCDKLVFRGGDGPATFLGNVQSWQGQESLLAGELELSGASGGMRADGKVAATLVLPSTADSPERRVELGGETMTFAVADRTLSFAGRAYVKLPGARLEAASVSAALGREGKAVETLAARTDVVLTKGRYEGRAGAAVYQAGPDRVTLTGRPVLFDPKGGSAKGSKLTFDLADDKILIENEGQGRSTTVVKS